MKELKEKFKECMRMLYPEGVENPFHRKDLVQVFFMGWIESLSSTNQKSVMIDLMGDFIESTQPGWLPDDSWDWTIKGSTND